MRLPTSPGTDREQDEWETGRVVPVDVPGGGAPVDPRGPERVSAVRRLPASVGGGDRLGGAGTARRPHPLVPTTQRARALVAVEGRGEPAAPDPFSAAVCRQAHADSGAWDVDASHSQRLEAAELCSLCPVVEACGRRREELGALASGTWAGVFVEWVDEDRTAAAFEAVFGRQQALQGAVVPRVDMKAACTDVLRALDVLGPLRVTDISVVVSEPGSPRPMSQVRMALSMLEHRGQVIRHGSGSRYTAVVWEVTRHGLDALEQAGPGQDAAADD